MPIAELRYEGRNIFVRSPYLPGFITELKQAIPWQHREWDASGKTWRVDVMFEHELMTLCDQFFDDIRIDRPPPPPPLADDDFRTLHLQADAPQPLVEAAYRSLAKLWHPDLNRDPAALARMQAINGAYDRIRERRR